MAEAEDEIIESIALAESLTLTERPHDETVESIAMAESHTLAERPHNDLEEFRREWRQEVESRHRGGKTAARGQDGAKATADRVPAATTTATLPAAAAAPASASSITASQAQATANDPVEPAAADRHVDAAEVDSSAACTAGSTSPSASCPAKDACPTQEVQEQTSGEGEEASAAVAAASAQSAPSGHHDAASVHSGREIPSDSDGDTDDGEPLPRGVTVSESSTSCDGETMDLYELFRDSQIEPEVPGMPGTHISALPADVLQCIFEWVVSSSLDVYTLEKLSEVCRQFYLWSRYHVLWRAVCRRIWGKATIAAPELSWRDHYLTVSHPLYHGCYVSSTMYYRSGEKSLDEFYKPYHTVVYYRYIRFFVDGALIIGCGSKHPRLVVGKLTPGTVSVPGVDAYAGTYCIQGDKIIGTYTVERPSDHSAAAASGRRRAGQQQDRNDVMRHIFHMGWHLEATKRQPFNRLVWDHYYYESLHPQRGLVYRDDLQLGNFYPPAIFSRVKSYTQYVTGPLETSTR
eukprot:scpid47602/ scgid10165/ F-box only protein 9